MIVHHLEREERREREGDGGEGGGKREKERRRRIQGERGRGRGRGERGEKRGRESWIHKYTHIFTCTYQVLKFLREISTLYQVEGPH